MADISMEDYLSNLFSERGVKAEFTMEEWIGGWVAIVGGVNGIPTAQQFNAINNIYSYWLKELASRISSTTGTANNALPKTKFTAAEIVGLLSEYGLMKNCDSDMLDGKHSGDFAPSSHNHSASDITSGTLSIARGGTGATDAAGALKNLDAASSSHNHNASNITSGTLSVARGGTGATDPAGALKNLGGLSKDGGIMYGDLQISDANIRRVNTTGSLNLSGGTDLGNGATLILRGSAQTNLNGRFELCTAGNKYSLTGLPDGSLIWNGNASFQRVTGATYNDYAEFMPRGEETEAGDIIALDTNSQTERYIKATQESARICGVHTDEWAHLIGGEPEKEGQDYLTQNLAKYIPIGLSGRVRTKIVGEIKTGDYIVPSEIPGVGRCMNTNDRIESVVGYVTESDSRKDVRRLLVRLGR